MKLVIVRGLPGSGKSTYAKTLGLKHFETDMFFERTGKYVFDPALIKDAHEWCQAQVKACLDAGEDVVVSNTFTMKWEAKAYFDMAEAVGAVVEVVTREADYGNIHGVPDFAIERMKARWEKF